MADLYVIVNRNGGFLSKLKNNKYIITFILDKALKLTYCKAQNTLHKSIKSDERDLWEIVEYEDQINHEKTTIDGDDIDWTMFSLAQEELYRNVTQYKTNLNVNLSEIDKAICDIQHFIELSSLNAAQGYKAYRMLRQYLMKRRFIKDELLRADCFLNGSGLDFCNGVVSKKINSLDNRKYKPRVLSELFESNDAKKHSSNIVQFKAL